MRISHKEITMTWIEFMQLTPEGVMSLCARGAANRPVEYHKQSAGFRTYTSVRTGKKVKAVPVVSV